MQATSKLAVPAGRNWAAVPGAPVRFPIVPLLGGSRCRRTVPYAAAAPEAPQAEQSPLVRERRQKGGATARLGVGRGAMVMLRAHRLQQQPVLGCGIGVGMWDCQQWPPVFAPVGDRRLCNAKGRL